MYGYLTLKLIVGYIALFAVTRFLGKRNIGQLSVMDFIATLLLSEFLGNALYDQKTQVGEFLFAMVLWAIFIYISEFISEKSGRFRKWMKGRPVILINKGEIDWKELKKNKIDIQDLLELLRSSSVFSMEEVYYGILENNGTLSVMKKSERETPVRRDLNLNAPQDDLVFSVIENGRPLKENLKEHDLDEKWLSAQLEKLEIDHISDVSYAEYKVGKELYVQKFRNGNTGS